MRIALRASFMSLGFNQGMEKLMGISVGAGYAHSLFEFAVAQGVDAHQLAGLAQYDPRVGAHTEARVSFDVFKALMRVGKELCQDPALGFKFGAQSQFRDMSIVGLIAYAAPTMGEAFEQMNRFAKLAIEVEGHDLRPRFSIERRDAEVWLHDHRLNANDFPELTESTFARFIGDTKRQFGDVPFAKHIHVTHSAPGYLEAYKEFWGVPVTFNSHINAISIYESWLSIQLHSPSAYAFGIFSERAEALLKELHQQTSIRARVEADLMLMLHTGNATIERVAANLGMSRTSLYRRLGEEGVTFAHILDDLRHRLAMNYLEAQKVSVSECGYLVGFSDPASFSRAFKRWTGKSPKEFK
jgi:AraC-like DNA-binding protein